jgi:acetylornithine deacetylase/succinyl-diaminopimelate desuccinylase-like protein
MNRALERAGVKSVGDLAEAAGVRQGMEWLTREKQWVNEQHLRISRISAPTFFEQERAEAMASSLRELGCEARLDGAGNVVARPRKTPEEPYIVLSAHLDTVLAARTPEEIVAEPGGRLRGPGVSDNGSGLAALLAIAGAIEAAPALEDRHCGLLLLANVCEEGEGNLSGMRHFCDESPLGEQARAFVVLDGPATDHITCAALESRRYEVSFSGPGGHSWSDFGVGNPAHALSRAVAHFLEGQDGAKSEAGSRTSYNFGVMEGGTSINAIPASARAKVDLRSESNQKMEELCSLLADSVERGAELENASATAGKVTAKVRLIGSRPGGRLSEQASILAFLKAVDSHLGIRARQDCASTDANIPLSKGLQAVSIGAGGQGGGAHTPLEWFHSGGRDLGLKRVLLLISLLMRDPLLGRGGE